MNKITKIITIIIVSLTVLSACSPKLSDKPAPDFTMQNQNGETVRLSDHYGKPIVLNFWGEWCPWCVKELPDFQKVYDECKEDVIFIMLNVYDEKSDAEAFISENGYSFPVYFDTEMNGTNTYGVTGFPTTVFIKSNGEYSHMKSGALSEESLRESISQIIDK